MLNPYKIGSDEQGYFFVTDSGLTYRIVFDDLDQIFNEYPSLQGRVFSYSFYPQYSAFVRLKSDERVKHTVVNSISEFFSKNDNLIVFVCHSTDRRDVCRKKLFDKWFKEFNAGQNLEKYDGIVESENYKIINAIIMKTDLTDKAFVLNTFAALNDEFTRAK